MKKILIFLVVILLTFSCKKNKKTFQVFYFNSITGQPMKGEPIRFTKIKRGFGHWISGNTLSTDFSEDTDEQGVAHFSDVLIKERKKFQYFLEIVNAHSGDFISNGNRIEIEENPSGKTFYFTIEPVIDKITIRPKDTATYQHASYEVKAECMFISTGLFHGNFSKEDNHTFVALYSLNKEYTKSRYPMGNYKIQIVRHQNNQTDTLNKDIYLERNEDFLYEFEF
jgi:hypothetical protein